MMGELSGELRAVGLAVSQADEIEKPVLSMPGDIPERRVGVGPSKERK